MENMIGKMMARMAVDVIRGNPANVVLSKDEKAVYVDDGYEVIVMPWRAGNGSPAWLDELAKIYNERFRLNEENGLPQVVNGRVHDFVMQCMPCGCTNIIATTEERKAGFRLNTTSPVCLNHQSAVNNGEKGMHPHVDIYGLTLSASDANDKEVVTAFYNHIDTDLRYVRWDKAVRLPAYISKTLEYGFITSSYHPETNVQTTTVVGLEKNGRAHLLELDVSKGNLADKQMRYYDSLDAILGTNEPTFRDIADYAISLNKETTDKLNRKPRSFNSYGLTYDLKDEYKVDDNSDVELHIRGLFATDSLWYRVNHKGNPLMRGLGRPPFHTALVTTIDEPQINHHSINGTDRFMTTTRLIVQDGTEAKTMFLFETIGHSKDVPSNDTGCVVDAVISPAPFNHASTDILSVVTIAITTTTEDRMGGSIKLLSIVEHQDGSFDLRDRVDFCIHGTHFDDIHGLLAHLSTIVSFDLTL